MSDRRIAVISGGLSFEREVSLRSGRRASDALRRLGVEVVELEADERLVGGLLEAKVDAAFLALHGRLGEDGMVAALLELLDVPYTGSGVDASRLAFDKLASKSALLRAEVAVPDAVPVTEAALRELGMAAVLERAVTRLGLPLVVKPNRGGSALGVRIVTDAAEVPGALMASFGYDDTALLERHVEGIELAVVVVDGLEQLPPVEIRPKHGWYDFAARYTYGAVDFLAPAEVPLPDLDLCLATARAAHATLGCRDLSRVDLILDTEGTSWVLEVNTGPGMTETSLLPMAVEASGREFGEVALHLTDRAIARRPR